jgi:hypothetical protein
LGEVLEEDLVGEGEEDLEEEDLGVIASAQNAATESSINPAFLAQV